MPDGELCDVCDQPLEAVEHDDAVAIVGGHEYLPPRPPTYVGPVDLEPLRRVLTASTDRTPSPLDRLRSRLADLARRWLPWHR